MKKLLVENSQSLPRLVDIPFLVTVYHKVTSQRYPGLRTLSSVGTVRLRPIASHQGIHVRPDGQTDGRYQTYYLPCFAVSIVGKIIW